MQVLFTSVGWWFFWTLYSCFMGHLAVLQLYVEESVGYDFGGKTWCLNIHYEVQMWVEISYGDVYVDTLSYNGNMLDGQCVTIIDLYYLCEVGKLIYL